MSSPKPSPSFRTKLFIAMMVLVSGVTGAALLVTQQSVAASYEKIFRQRFASEVALFSAAQDARLGAVKDKCLELARSVRLVAAIEEHDTALLYQIASDELREVMSPDIPLRALRPATFFRVLDAEGRVLAPADLRAGAVADAHDWEGALSRAARAMPANDRQGFGYLALATSDGRDLHEVVLTRITDPVRRRALGVLAIGFPLPEATAIGKAAVRTAVWLSGELYSNALPPAARREIARVLADDSSPPAGELVVTLDGVPHRLLYRALSETAGFPAAAQVSVYSLEDSLLEQARLRRRVLAFGLAGLAVALLLSLVISRGLSVPIHDLAAATAEIQRGNLAVEVPVRRTDEIGRLARAFNEMARGLEEKEKYRSLLDLVADKEVAVELLRGDVALGGELRDVSILFCDIRGFTALTERMAPAEIIELLNEHMTALTAVVHEHRGVVDKFVGDLVMAVFGAPRSRGDDGLAAVACARQMIGVRERLNAISRHQVTVGIGIASGTVVAGCMGSKERLNYTVLGERVNLASRLCARAGPMEILIDPPTYERISGRIAADALPGLSLKGFSGEMAAYRVTDVVALDLA
jgi:class 3 adenylate cyclase